MRAYSNISIVAGTYIEEKIKVLDQESKNNNSETISSDKTLKISSIKVKHTFISDRKMSKKGNIFVCQIQISVPKKELDRELINNIKKTEKAYENYKSSATFKKLEAEVNSE